MLKKINILLFCLFIVLFNYENLHAEQQRNFPSERSCRPKLRTSVKGVIPPKRKSLSSNSSAAAIPPKRKSLSSNSGAAAIPPKRKSFSSNSSEFAYYPRSLKSVVQDIYSFSGTRQLLAKVNREGAVGIAVNHSNGFQACWNSGIRKISVNPGQNRTKGSLITSIVFELHNALSDRKFNEISDLAASGQLSKDAYVERVERMEHENALAACTLLNRGIEQNIFPKDAEWPIFKDFYDHYAVQQLTGHSDQIASEYDMMHGRTQPFGGTIPDVRSLPEHYRQKYCMYLSIKNDLQSERSEVVTGASSALQMECQKLENASHDKHRLALMEKVFKGNPIYEVFVQKSTVLTRLLGRRSRRLKT